MEVLSRMPRTLIIRRIMNWENAVRVGYGIAVIIVGILTLLIGK